MIGEAINRKIRELANGFNLELLLLFGSQVSGRVHKESDYDIGYISSHKLNLDEEGRLINALVAVVGADDERKINLVNIKKAKPLLLYAITSEYKVLYEREPQTLAQLRVYAFKKYVEAKPIYEEKARRLREVLKV